jgi:methionyl-tRNA formyltransferase
VRAEAAGLEVLTPDRLSDPRLLERLVELAPDCCPVVAYGGLVPAAALAVPAAGWVNLHFSLLPAWRGAAPVQRALWAGDAVTGATTFRLDEGLDTGPVLGTVTEPIRPADTSGELLRRLSASGAELLVRTLDGIEDGELVAVPQPADGVSYAPKVSVDEARVSWGHPALGIERQLRACTPSPGAWTTMRGERVKLGPAGLEPPSGRPLPPLAPGELLVQGPAVLVGTGSVPLRLGEVQPPGRRPMPADAWLRGIRPAAGERLQ